MFWNKPEDLIPTLDVTLHSLYVHARAALASWHLSVALFLKCVCCWNRQVLLRSWEATVSTSSLVFQFRAVCLAQSSGYHIVPGSCVVMVGLELTILIHFPGNTGEILNVKLLLFCGSLPLAACEQRGSFPSLFAPDVELSWEIENRNRRANVWPCGLSRHSQCLHPISE